MTHNIDEKTEIPLTVNTLVTQLSGLSSDHTLGVIVLQHLLNRHRQPYCQPMLEQNLLDTVITLPETLFPGTNYPTALLLLTPLKTDNNVLLVDASQELKTTDQQPKLAANAIAKIIAAYRRVRTVETEHLELSSPVCYAPEFDLPQLGVVVDNYAYLASINEIREKDYCLAACEYMKKG